MFGGWSVWCPELDITDPEPLERGIKISTSYSFHYTLFFITPSLLPSILTPARRAGNECYNGVEYERDRYSVYVFEETVPHSPFTRVP